MCIERRLVVGATALKLSSSEPVVGRHGNHRIRTKPASRYGAEAFVCLRGALEQRCRVNRHDIGAVRAVKLPTTAFSLTSLLASGANLVPEKYLPGERVFTGSATLIF